MRHKSSLAFVAAFAVFPLGSAIAQVGESGSSLPPALAVTTCANNDYPVSAVAVAPSGVTKLEAKGDHPTIHTTASAFGEAYTVVTSGPIFRFNASSAFAALVAKIQTVQRSRRCPMLQRCSMHELIKRAIVASAFGLAIVGSAGAASAAAASETSPMVFTAP